MSQDAALSGNTYDVVVVGGGIHGATAAWTTARLGLRTALVDMGDFGAATSASSLKVLHGGLRYLQHANFSRMRESIRARRRFLQLAPHLCRPQAFLMPTRGSGVRSRAALAVALTLNDLIAADRNVGVCAARRVPPGRLLSEAEARELLAGFNDPGLTGAAVWYDGLGENTERLTLSFVLSAEQAGARVANYTEATGLVVEQGQVAGVAIRNGLAGTEETLRTRLVINATGPWLEQRWQGGTAGGETFPLVGAWNLVVARRWFGSYGIAIEGRKAHRDADALVQRGKRNLFLVPWREGTMIGTVYEPFTGDPAAYRPRVEDVREFIDEINAVYPPARLTLGDITYLHVGVQPGPRGRTGGSVEPDKHSEVIDHGATGGPRGLLGIKGVKYTTGLEVGERAGLQAARMLGRAGRLAPVAFYGAKAGDAVAVQAAARVRGLTLDSEAAARLAAQYGGAVDAILKEAEADGAAALPGAPSYLFAEVRHAVRREHARRLEDVVIRRTEVGSFRRPADETLRAMADTMAALLGWTPDRVEDELRRVASRYPHFA